MHIDQEFFARSDHELAIVKFTVPSDTGKGQNRDEGNDHQHLNEGKTFGIEN